MSNTQYSRIEKNIYVEQRSGAFRFVVAVYGSKKETATFSTMEEGKIWAKRRRLQILLEKSEQASSESDVPSRAEHRQTAASVKGEDPSNIPMSVMFKSFEDTELSRLAGEDSARSRLRRLSDSFGSLTLGQLDFHVLENWKISRLTGRLGSGRGGHRASTVSDEEMLTKHQRHYRKKTGKTVEDAPVRPVSTQTVRHELVLLRQVIKTYFSRTGLSLVHGSWLHGQYVMQMKLPPKSEPRDRRLTDDEVTSILSEVSNDVARSAILIALLTTLRRSEVLSLRWEHVDFERRTVGLKMPGHYRRTKIRARQVPLLPGAMEVLRKLQPKESGLIFEITPNGLSQAWRRAADRAGALSARLHDCRREAISRLIETCKIPLSTVVVFSGHSDVGTLQRHYVRLNPSLIATELALLPEAGSFVPIL